MQLMLGFFYQRDFPFRDEWVLAKVAPTLRIDHETWPRAQDQFGSPDPEMAVGVVTVTQHDGAWRAECIHPGDGEPVAVGGVASREEALAALKAAVRQPWLGRDY